jgi:hypothetical protein
MKRKRIHISVDIMLVCAIVACGAGLELSLQRRGLRYKARRVHQVTYAFGLTYERHLRLEGPASIVLTPADWKVVLGILRRVQRYLPELASLAKSLAQVIQGRQRPTAVIKPGEEE